MFWICLVLFVDIGFDIIRQVQYSLLFVRIRTFRWVTANLNRKSGPVSTVYAKCPKRFTAPLSPCEALAPARGSIRRMAKVQHYFLIYAIAGREILDCGRGPRTRGYWQHERSKIGVPSRAAAISAAGRAPNGKLRSNRSASKPHRPPPRTDTRDNSCSARVPRGRRPPRRNAKARRRPGCKANC
jgi:hypothetical protein